MARRALGYAADGAALAGATALDEDALRRGAPLSLDPTKARALAEAAMREAAPPGSSWEIWVSTEKVGVKAALRVPGLFLPLIGLPTPEVRVTVTARARQRAP